MEQSKVLAALSALAHETRLDIVRLLVARGPQGMCAGGIAQRLGLSASALSFHLSALGGAGLLAATRQGRHVHYRVDLGQIGAVMGYMLNDCCADHPEVRRSRLERCGQDQSGRSNT